ncbi:MAG: YcxB family protein [Muribaculaceae bacterium]|nr:YcxB family protein [Muribaculaceae bacterium]
MDKISYTLTVEDCKDYVVAQYKIPRIKKFIMKTFVPFWIMGGIFVVVLIVPLFINLLSGLSYLVQEGEMSFFKALTDFQMCEFYKSALLYFVKAVLPLIVIWVLIFAIAWGIGATDAFSISSKRVFKMLEGRALDAEIEVQENGLAMSNKNASSFIEWSGIVDIHETKSTFLIFVSKYQAVIVPKRAFATEDIAKEFFNIVDEKSRAAKA